MINLMEEISRFKHVNIDELERERGDIPDDIKQSIDLYNKALEDMRHGNEDMAIIALKKAVAINNCFYEAINLMGLCFLKLGDKDKAENMFNKVISAEKNGIKALDYLLEMEEETPSNYEEDIENHKKARFISWFKRGIEKETDNPYYLKYIVGFILGIICMTTVWHMVPSGKALINLKDANLEKSFNKQKKQIDELTGQLESSKQNLRILEKQNVDLLNKFKSYKKHSTQLMEIILLKDRGNYQEAADKLIMLQTIKFEDELQDRYDELWQEVIPIAAKEEYDEAVKIYYSKKNINDVKTCSKALIKFKRVLQLGDDWDFMPDFYYVGGKCAFRAQEPELARKWFQKVIDLYPESNIAIYAKDRIKEIDEGKPIIGS